MLDWTRDAHRYSAWKSKFQKKATAEQLARFEATKSLAPPRACRVRERRYVCASCARGERVGSLLGLEKREDDSLFGKCECRPWHARHSEIADAPASASSARDDLERDEAAAAIAFDSIVRHLRLVSSEAPNIDVMNAAGMCRNCLAKWYHAAARAVGRPVRYDDASDAPARVSPTFC